jgi:hypothetical protein
MARRVSGFFDELHFTECFLGEPEWRGGAMVAQVRDLFACGDHPLAGEDQPLAGRLVFGGVARSTRSFYEYVRDPGGGTGFRPGCVIEDGGTGEADRDLTDYRFGGVREQPRGWMEWRVWARSFELEVGPFQE